MLTGGLAALLAGNGALTIGPTDKADTILVGQANSGSSSQGAVPTANHLGFSSVMAPAAPTFTMGALSGTQISVSWHTVSGASGYLIDEWINGAWRQIGSFGSGATGCTVAGLSPNATYYFDVGAYNSAGVAWANYQGITTSPTLRLPAAPSFAVSVVSSTQINLAWNTVSGASGYLVDELINGAWKQIGSFGSGATGYSVTGLSANSTYYFDVAAYNSAGVAWANYQSATTRGAGGGGGAGALTEPAAQTGYSAVSGSLFGANGPSYLDVEQGYLGDCWLLASLAAVAARDPADIRSMFTADGTAVENGSAVSLYTVRFYNSNGVAQYVTVDTELPSGGDYYDYPANGVLWVALAEKAYAEANGAGIVTTMSERSDSYAALNGGDPAWALQAITGKSANDFAINPANIAAAWNAGEIIVLGSSPTPASPYIVGDSQGTHAYAVVNYTASSSSPFEVYNPWGTNSAGWALGTFNGHEVYGLFWASASFLSQNFAGQSIGMGAVDPAGLDTVLQPLHPVVDVGQADATSATPVWSADTDGNSADKADKLVDATLTPSYGLVSPSPGDENLQETVLARQIAPQSSEYQPSYQETLAIDAVVESLSRTWDDLLAAV
jgi:hypothetical protein